MKYFILIILLFAFLGVQAQQVVYKKDTLDKQQTVIVDSIAKGVFIQSFYKYKTSDTIWLLDYTFMSIEMIERQAIFFEGMENQIDDVLLKKKEDAKKNKEYYQNLKSKYDKK